MTIKGMVYIYFGIFSMWWKNKAGSKKLVICENDAKTKNTYKRNIITAKDQRSLSPVFLYEIMT